MKAAVVEHYKEPLVIENVAEPTHDPDGVLVEVKACGVCRSDWHGWQGEWPGFTGNSLPHIFGHEFVGQISETGTNVSRYRVGDRVIVPFTLGCGHCEYCRSGHSNVCPEVSMPGFSYDGGFAQFVAVPDADANLVKLPDTVTFTDAAGMGCRFMTAYHGVIEVGRIHPGDWLVVYGAGGVGLSATLVATSAGANVIAVDLADDKLKLARKVGAVETINSHETDPVAAVRELTGGGADKSIDALGISDTLHNAVNSLRSRGIHIQIGMTPEGPAGQVPLTINDIVSKEIDFRGSFGMPAVEFRYLLNQVAAGKVKPGQLVAKTIALSEVNDALTAMSTYNTVGTSVITDFTR